MSECGALLESSARTMCSCPLSATSPSISRLSHPLHLFPLELLPPPSPVLLVHPIVILDFSFFPAALSPSLPVSNGARPPLEGGAAARAAGKPVAGAAAIRARAKGRPEDSSCSSLQTRKPQLYAHEVEPRLLWRGED
ncbi:hypothetical protein MSAN_01193200 [Mycena sanguinolenta]|uniref:Uncharacterized protein n=1 Tax=Mycena sanguinolenta TaxID=230812 RepID=A0A8H6YMU9_9AGAR|nr:hypothetical protein MSAN_01193200 [Mycena sanguinolenta]